MRLVTLPEQTLKHICWKSLGRSVKRRTKGPSTFSISYCLALLLNRKVITPIVNNLPTKKILFINYFEFFRGIYS